MLLATGFAAAALSIATRSAGDPVPERALQRLARVAELYRDNALGFACEETIAYSGRRSGRLQFAYLFIRDDSGKLRDFRTWKTGTTAEERGREVDPADYDVPRFLTSAYLFAFVFRSDRQPLYRFYVAGEDQIDGRSAMRIQFIPRNPIRKGLNDWVGYADIDRETSQILKVDAYTPANWNLLVRRDTDVAAAEARKLLDDYQTYEIERVATEFGFEKNGMRFPSHVEITTTRFTVLPGGAEDPYREKKVRAVTQDYSKFEFFSVRSSDEITRFVNGDGPLPLAK
jgi:hypothetical protein